MSAHDSPAPLGWKLKSFGLVVGTLYSGYQITNHWHWRPPVTLPLTWLDRAIPLLEWTVWPYLVLAGCMFLPLLLSDRQIFRRCLTALGCGYSVNLLVFAMWPTMLPREGLPDGWHRTAFAWLYAVDSPANCFPSGHITAPFIAFHALAMEHRRWRGLLWLAFALLCPTILTTKQHYVVDLVGGLATGALGVWLSGLWLGQLQRNQNDPAQPRSPVFNGGLVNLIRFQRDPLHFLAEVNRECGPVVKCRLAWLKLILVNDPAAARAILKLPHHSANKDTRSAACISLVSGRSLLTANGDSWFRLRRLVQPAFHHQRLAGYAAEIERLAGQMIAEWKAAPGGRVEVGAAMRQLTFRFICRVLLSADPSKEINALEVSINQLLTAVWQSIRSPFDWSLKLPTRNRQQFDAALAHVRGFIQGRLTARRNSGAPSAHDLLAMLMEACDADTRKGMSEDEIINECVTLVLAGYDTTANALAWSLTLLAQHQDVAASLRAEPESATDAPYARAVFLETLRLYPPIWIIERNLDEAVTAGPWHFAAGAQLIISPWVLHRSPYHWENPEAFRPERFLDPAVEHSAFLPFGDGPRTCIGKGLAMMEGVKVLALVGKAGTLAMAGPIPSPDPGIALRPHGEVWMTLT